MSDNLIKKLDDVEKLLYSQLYTNSAEVVRDTIAELAAKDAALELYEKKLAIAIGALERIKSREAEFEEKVNAEPPQSVAWWNLGDIAAAALKRLEGAK